MFGQFFLFRRVDAPVAFRHRRQVLAFVLLLARRHQVDAAAEAVGVHRRRRRHAAANGKNVCFFVAGKAAE